MFFAGVKFLAALSVSVNFLKIGNVYLCIGNADIVRHLGTPNLPSSLTSMDVTGCVIQYYTDQWRHLDGKLSRAPFNVSLF